MQRDYIGYLLAILSVIVGVYVSYHYYEKSVQQRLPLFVVDWLPATVYDTTHDIKVPIKVTGEDGKPLTSSVHVATNVFWNSGNLPITNKEILEPIQITLTADLLSVAVVKQSRNVVECAVDQIAVRAFEIRFRILEQDDGCQIRIFYSGLISPEYSIRGEIVGVKKLTITNRSYLDYLKHSSETPKWYKRAIGNLPRTLPWLALIFFLYQNFESNTVPTKRKLLALAALISFFLLTVGLNRLYMSLWSYEPPPIVDSHNWVSSNSTQ
jgi:hypothetical protein